MPQFDDNVVACFNAFLDIGPQLVVECSRTGSAQGLVLHGDLVGIEVFVLIKAPAPLAVVAVALGACAHGGVAYEKEHGVVVHTAAASYWAGGFHLLQRVQRPVDHFVDIVHRTKNVLLGITAHESHEG